MIPGSWGMKSHIRLLAWSLNFPVSITLPLFVSHEYINKGAATVENSLEGPREVKNRGSLGAQWFGACLSPRAWSWRPGIESHVGLPGHVACFSLCLCLCLSLCDYHKKIFFQEEVKNRATLRFQNCTARYLPWGYKSSLVDSKGNTQPSVGSSIINNSETVYTAQMSIDDEWAETMW